MSIDVARIGSANLGSCSLDAPRGRVLVVDDDPDVLRSVGSVLERGGFLVDLAADFGSALESLDSDSLYDAVLTDLYLAEASGLDLLTAVRERRPHLQVVVMTGQGTIARAVEAMRSGAFDFLTKPIPSAEQLRALVQRVVAHSRLLLRNRYLESRLELADRFSGIVAHSRAMLETLQMVESVAPTASTVLIQGESGTGKEVVARTIHERSSRERAPFIAVNCGALTESVLESELFGHVRGAFTGALQNRRGLFEQASGGTIFLDEIGELSPQMQVRLLRVLQEGEIRAVGDSKSRSVDVRVLAATHRDLGLAIRERRFREDLFYRLNVIAIHVAPLRDRREDILPLAHHFLSMHATKIGKDVGAITAGAAEVIERYTWPGNVRELSNAIERAVVLSRGCVIDEFALPAEVREAAAPPPVPRASSPRAAHTAPEAIVPLAQAREQFEVEYLTNLMSQSDGNISVAAERSAVDRSNLRRMLKRHQLSPSSFRAGVSSERS